jgi:LacI family gluconate utilization system Gnt-I transcriptional repressor
VSHRRAPTMKDLARRAGVSPITASRALSDSTAVKYETAKRVRQAAEELGYLRNHAARTFSARGSRLVSLIVPNVSNSVFALTIEGLNDVLSAAGYSIVIGYSGYSKYEEERLLRSLLGYQPEGVILTGLTHTDGTRELLRRFAKPVVEIWNLGLECIDVAVGFSNFEAAASMTRYLVGQGHRHLAYAGGTQTDNDRTQAREAGFRHVLKQAGLPVREDLISSLPMELESGSWLAQTIARMKHRPDALFAASDIIAAGFILECSRIGIRVPFDIAVAGFDDTPLAHAIEPRLTTVYIPQRQIGMVAAETILSKIKGTARGAVHHDLGFEIIVRSSA